MTYVNDHSVLGVGILFTVLGTVAITTRFYALVTGEAVIMMIGSATHTVGAHFPADIGAAILYYDGWDQVLLERLESPFDIMQPLALALLKLSVLFFYRRLFVGRIFDIASWTLIGVVIAWGITFVIALTTTCGATIMANFGTLNTL
ncbi:hypothetical protein BO99DRAFT_438697 [Aspergillus violaceofuscus CBS 115571]|uniref:Rhodopsin domain-containing protein n=1 Tax=Aspergillus violaceofuscus (strain CBS 115571) TaxID=1450538 RepID=A0A2V5HLY2_ASPV1|nr:hypothetical protein BO99DRAFT_438697 [Aspergillus violaceofuscus CBS 115571]